MKKFALIAALGLASILAQHPAWAQSGAVQRSESAAGPNASVNARFAVLPMGIIYGINTPVTGAAGISEQVLGTWAMPAGTLDIAGRRLRITANFQHAANTNNVSAKLYFGSEALATANTATSGAATKIECDVLKTAASAQQVTCWGLGGAAGVVPVTYSAAGTETDTAAITIKASVTGGTSGADGTLSDFYVEILN
jgi:hypothetical protein